LGRKFEKITVIIRGADAPLIASGWPKGIIQCIEMHRIEVSLKNHLPDARGLGLVRDIQDLGITTISGARVMGIYWLDADLAPHELDLMCQSLLSDPVTQEYQCSTSSSDIKGREGKLINNPILLRLLTMLALLTRLRTLS